MKWILALYLFGQSALVIPHTYQNKSSCELTGVTAVAEAKRRSKHALAWYLCIPIEVTDDDCKDGSAD